MISFAQPIWIVLGIAACLLLWLLWRSFEQSRHRRLSAFAGSALLIQLTASISPARRSIKKLLLLGAVFLCFTALARPQYGYRWIDVKQKGIDILFALDTSKSMLVEDIRPNRLERSKLAILDFVSKLSGDRVGLLPFAGASYLMCPLTSDYQAFEQTLMAVDQGTIEAGGTDISSMLLNAARILSNDANHKILILISDGEQLEGDLGGAAELAAQQKMTIHTVGVGTEQGELIPDRKSGGFIQDDQGRFIRSRLDQANLQMIADTTGGLYVPLGEQNQGLETIYREKLTLIPKTERGERRKQVPVERFGWPLALAIILLSVEFLLSGRKPDQTIWRRIAWRRPVRSSGLIMLGLALLLSSAPARLYSNTAEDGDGQGDDLKTDKHLQKLLEKDPDNPLLHYNQGTKAYQNKRFENARQSFDRALATDDVDLQEKTYYNRANALYRLGESALQTEPESTLENWRDAVASYENVLSLNPDNKRAQANHRFVSAKLEELEKQQERRDKQDQTSENTQDSESEQQSEQQPRQEQGGQEQGQEQQQPQKDKAEPKSDADEQDQPGPDDPDRSAQDKSPSQNSDGRQGPAEERAPENLADEAHGNSGVAASPSEALQDPAAMSRAEAELLLQALQNEEGRIDFYAPRRQKERSSKQDW